MSETPVTNRDKLLGYGIYSEGTDITESVHLISMSVRLEINKIGKATLTLDAGEKTDKTFADSDGNLFIPGKNIKLTAGYNKQQDTLFEGTVITHRLTVNNHKRAELIIECRDYAYAATLGRKNAVFEKMTDSAVIKKIAETYGLSVTTDSTSAEYPQLIQYYCTDWDFMLSRADANGLMVITEEKKISFKKPETSAAAVLTVSYGEDLIRFDGSVSASEQYTKTIASGWDIDTQKIQTVTGATPGLNSQGDIAPNKLADAGGGDLLYQTNAAVSKNALQAWADAQALKNGLARYQGSIEFDGNALAKPGCIIELKGMGTHFNGSAYIGSVEHTIQQNCWTTCAGMGISPQNVTSQADAVAPAASGLLPGIEGLHIGIVKSISDEKDAGQCIEVEIPLLNGDKNIVWARPASYYATMKAGSFFFPETGDEVVIGFFNNDPCHPVMLGSLYSSKHTPPIPLTSENYTKAIITKALNKITFDDEKKIITIETPGKNIITLDDDGEQILLTDKNKNKITLDKNGIVIESAKDLELKAKGNIKLSATQKLETESKSDTTLKGMNVNVTAQVGVKIKGSATAELSASGQTTVKGGMVMIN